MYLSYVAQESTLAAPPHAGLGAPVQGSCGPREEVKLHISCPSFPVFIPSCLLYMYRHTGMLRKYKYKIEHTKFAGLRWKKKKKRKANFPSIG